MIGDLLQALTHEVLWQAFFFLGDQGVCALASTRRGLLSQSSCARLHFNLVRLNAEYQTLTAIPQRLCPGGGGSTTSKTMRSVQKALKQLRQVAEQGDLGDQTTLATVLPWIGRGDCATR